MPTAPRHYCHGSPTCPHKVPPDCPDHPTRAPWASEAPRIRGRKLQRLRAALFAEQPLCVACLAKVPEQVTVATIRDHIIPLAEGGEDEQANVQALCQACSDEKTARESLRGRMRAR